MCVLLCCCAPHTLDVHQRYRRRPHILHIPIVTKLYKQNSQRRKTNRVGAFTVKKVEPALLSDGYFRRCRNVRAFIFLFGDTLLYIVFIAFTFLFTAKMNNIETFCKSNVIKKWLSSASRTAAAIEGFNASDHCHHLKRYFYGLAEIE